MDTAAPRVALVTCAAWPNGEEEDAPLLEALTAAGAVVGYVCWDDPSVQWPTLDAAVVRSTWDYHERPAAFLEWADYTGSVTHLMNDAAMLRWNAHKSYLLELAGAGVPVVPTVVVPKGGTHRVPEGEWVVKPAISIGAEQTHRGATQADLEAITATGDALLQPYLREVTDGEVSVVCIGGRPTHAVRKVPAPGDFRTQAHHGAEITAVAISGAHAQLAQVVLGLLPRVPAYARVDVVDTVDGPLLMELELIEPCLWFTAQPSAAGELAALVVEACGTPPGTAGPAQ